MQQKILRSTVILSHPMAVVANLWHGCQRQHSEPSLWACTPSPQHRVRQSSLLESQRDAGPGYSLPALHARLRTFLTSRAPLPSSPLGTLPPSPVWGTAGGSPVAWTAAC